MDGNEFILKGLFQNAAILLSIYVLYERFWIKNLSVKNNLTKILSGIVIGSISIILMISPWILRPGLVFDTRSVLLSISGLFFGFLPTLIAVLISAVFRYFLSGPGKWMGIAVIITSGMIGVIWGKLRSKWMEGNHIKELFHLGIIVHAVMILCGLLLPFSIALRTMKTIVIPIVVVYIPAMVLLGSLMVDRLMNWKHIKQKELAEAELVKNKIFMESLIEGIQDGISVLDKNMKIILVNGSMKKMFKENLSLVGKKCYQAFHNQDEICEPCPARRCLKSGKVEWEIIKGPPGSEIEWAELYSYPRINPDTGAVTGVIEFVRDISQQKNAEDELLEIKSNLQIKVEEKTSELNKRVVELQRFFDATVERELRMKELYDENEKLRSDKDK